MLRTTLSSGCSLRINTKTLFIVRYANIPVLNNWQQTPVFTTIFLLLVSGLSSRTSSTQARASSSSPFPSRASWRVDLTSDWHPALHYEPALPACVFCVRVCMRPSAVLLHSLVVSNETTISCESWRSREPLALCWRGTAPSLLFTRHALCFSAKISSASLPN